MRSIEALRAYESAYDVYECVKKWNDEFECEFVVSSGKVDIEFMEVCVEVMCEVFETTAVKFRAIEVYERNTRRVVEVIVEVVGFECECMSVVKKVFLWFNVKVLGEVECV